MCGPYHLDSRYCLIVFTSFLAILFALGLATVPDRYSSYCVIYILRLLADLPKCCRNSFRFKFGYSFKEG